MNTEAEYLRWGNKILMDYNDTLYNRIKDLETANASLEKQVKLYQEKLKNTCDEEVYAESVLHELRQINMGLIEIREKIK